MNHGDNYFEKKEKKSFSILPKSTGLAIAMLITGFAEIVFLAFVLALDVLPFKYLATGILLLLAIDFLIVFLATSMSKHGTRRIGCLVIIFTMLITLLGGDYYIFSTNDTLSKISAMHDTWEYYDVIVNVNSSYEKARDIKGKTIFVTDMDSKQLKEAKERLVTKEDVTYAKEPNFVAVGEHLINREIKEEEVSAVETAADNSKNVDKSEAAATVVSNGNTLADTEADSVADEDDKSVKAEEAIALVSESQYKILKGNIENYKENTKCIYQIKVKKRADDTAKRVDVTKDSFNVLISGIDCWGRTRKEGLSDVNMVMTINPTTRQVLLTSIPRDSYVTLHSYGGQDKLTHSGIYGEEETRKTIEDMLGIDINYTVRVNFSALVGLVNAVGGIDVYSEYAFKSSISHWEYQKGWNRLTGHSALYFARERKSFTDGDMQRNRQQQIVLEALIDKVTSSKVILTRYTKILDAIENDISTDMTGKDMKKMVKMQLSDMKKWSIERANIEGPTGLAPCFSMGGMELSCVFPSEETISAAKEDIHDIMYPVKNEEKTESTEE